jgi:ferredoxin
MRCSDHTTWRRLRNAFRLLPSTRMGINEARHASGFGLIDSIHGYLYARWPYLYIGIGAGKHRSVARFHQLYSVILNFLCRLPSDHPRVSSNGLHPGAPVRRDDQPVTTFADTYHAKVLPLEAARKLVSVNQPVRLPGLEHVIPYTTARDLILRHPLRIAAMQCPCRSIQTNPCLPLEVCLVVGEPFASFAVEHHPTRTRWISQEEAAEILQSEAARGHVHHAFFKQALLGRFFAICNCCACCCEAIHIHRNGIPMLAGSGYVARLNQTRCAGCGICIAKCPFLAIALVDGVAKVDPGRCMGCGVCSSLCPQEALQLVRNSGASPPLELDELMAQRV